MKSNTSRQGARQDNLQPPGNPGVPMPFLAKLPPQTPEGRNHPVILQVIQANQNSQTITIRQLDIAWSFFQNTG